MWGGCVHVCMHACLCVCGAPRSVSHSHSPPYTLRRNLLLNLELAILASLRQGLLASISLLGLEPNYHCYPACMWVLGNLSSTPHPCTATSPAAHRLWNQQ